MAATSPIAATRRIPAGLKVVASAGFPYRVGVREGERGGRARQPARPSAVGLRRAANPSPLGVVCEEVPETSIFARELTWDHTS
jgi:hypothetical protein